MVFYIVHRWAHKPGGDVWVVLGEEVVVCPIIDVRGGPVPGGHLRGGAGEGIPEELLR